MSSKLLDFDLFMAEHTKETLEVKVYGKIYKIVKEVPAVVPVMMARAEESANSTLSGQMVMRAADGWFGEDAVNEFCAKGMSTSELRDLVTKVFSAVRGTDEDEDDAEEYTDEDSRVAKPSKAKK